MSVFGQNRERSQRLSEVETYLEKAEKEVTSREPRITALTSWLHERRLINGVGADIEWTVRPAHGGTHD